MNTFLAMTMIMDLFLQTYFRSINLGISNRGVSFGWWPGVGQTVAMLVFLGLIIFTVTKQSKVNWPLRLLILGGLGNLLPRFFWGSVWDYLYLPFLPFWFNLSDVMISVGVLSYILKGNGNTDSL